MATAYQSLILSEPSLVHYYEMNETSGNSCIDTFAGHTGTYNGSPGFLAVNLGQTGIPAGGFSVQFLGSGSGSTGVTIGVFATGGTGETLEAWVYLAALPPIQSVVATHSIKSGGQYSTLIEINPNGTVRWYMATTSGGPYDTTTTAVLSLNTWHHLVISAPTNGTAFLYIDGVAAGPGIPIGTLNGIATSLYLDIGNYDDGTAVATYKICNVAIYNSALSGSDILQHYNVGMSHAAAVVSQIVVETLVKNTPISYVTQVVTETLVQNNPLLYLTQLTSEVAVKNNPSLYLTQLTTEVALQGNPSLYLTQLVTEVAYPNPGVGTPPATGALTTQFVVEVVTTTKASPALVNSAAALLPAM
jgi:hypothetical protein